MPGERFYRPDMMATEGWVEIEPCRPNTRLLVHELWVCDGRKTFFLGREAFRSPREATEKAIEQRRKRIDRLRNQIKVLEKLGV